MRDKYASSNTEYKVVGVMIIIKVVFVQVRNPNYEMVRQLRGNQPKKQYRYLLLRQEGKVSDYLNYYSEDKKFSIFRIKYINLNQLHDNYLKCFVLKHYKLNDFPFQFKSHMYILHEKYLTYLNQK